MNEFIIKRGKDEIRILILKNIITTGKLYKLILYTLEIERCTRDNCCVDS